MSAELLPLRPYQREAIDAVWAAHAGGMQRPAIVLPTGAGKTVVMSHAIREYRSSQLKRAMVLVHRDELADQTIAKLRAVAPHLKVGKVKAQDNEVGADVVVASVQTVSRPQRLAQLRRSENRYGSIGFVLTDECHHAVAASYGTVYDAFPHAVHLGVTATMARGDGAGLGKTWDDVVYQRSILRMIADGFLVDVKAVAVQSGLDLSQVKKSGGDYSAASLGAALEEIEGHKVVAKAMLQHARDRRSVVFTPTVAVAEETAKELTSVGIPAGVVSGATPREERQAVYAAFASGRLRALVNCMVLTEGWDMPQADCCVIARPTQSAPLFIQMVGRVLRPFPGKGAALVLDIAGTGGRVSTLVDLSDEDAPVRSIKDGETLAEAAVREEAEANLPVKAGSIAFALKHREMDLFSASTAAWLRTPEGVMFIVTRAGEVFLWPSKTAPGTWMIGLAPGQSRPWRVLRDGLPLGTAMAWAETIAEENNPEFSTERKAPWRRKPADAGQRGYYRARYGGQLPDQLTAGELSDLIAVAEAARKFDQKMKGVRR